MPVKSNFNSLFEGEVMLSENNLIISFCKKIARNFFKMWNVRAYV